MLERLKARFAWSWVGTVEGVAFLHEKSGRVPRSCFWVLNVRGDGKRRAKLIGFNHQSQSSLRSEAQVKAWVAGGPVPPLVEFPVGDRKGLHVIKGGKDA